jgi:hypothetical protein
MSDSLSQPMSDSLSQPNEQEEEPDSSCADLLMCCNRLSVGALSSSKKKQLILMLGHFKTFLSNPSTAPSPPIPMDFTLEQLNEGVIASWTNYLSHHANCKGGGGTTRPLSRQTAVSYFSAFKSYVIIKFGRDVMLPVCMNANNWSHYLAQIATTKNAAARRNGVPVVKSRNIATEDDRLAISVLSFWKGTVEASQFQLFCILAFQCIGRGGEVAMLTKQSLSHNFLKDKSGTYNILSLQVERPKTDAPTTVMALFPDRISLLLCPYFSIAHYFVMSKDESPTISLLPTWAEKLDFDTNDRAMSQKVSAYFAKLLQSLQELVESYVENKPDDGHDDGDDDDDDDFDSGDVIVGLSRCNLRLITSHSFRKSGMSQCADDSFLFKSYNISCSIFIRYE